MKSGSFYGKALAVLIALSAFAVPSSNIVSEAEDAYEQAAYQALIKSQPTAAPTQEPVPTAEAIVAQATQGAQATATMLPTFAPTEEPAYELPMDTYEGGYAPKEENYSTIDGVELPDGTTTTAECYKDPSIEAICYKWRLYDSDIHIIRIKVSHASQLRTAISKEAVGNSTSVTAEMASTKNAVVAINGEYYSQREGAVFIVKQSNVIKSSPARSLHQLIIDTNGDFHITTSRSDSESMIAQIGSSVYQGFTFGPALVVDGVATSYDDYQFDADGDNPRAAIGQIGHLEYIICAVDGRNDENKGVTASQLADIMAQIGCTSAYNLDGGGSTSLYWHGQIINHMNYSGNQREISDIVYFASSYPG